MNLIELAKKTKDFLSADERKRKEKKKFLKHVLKKLKKHEETLRVELEDAKNEEQRASLQSEIVLTYAQRKKGIANLEKLKKKEKKEKVARQDDWFSVALGGCGAMNILAMHRETVPSGLRTEQQ